MWQSFSKFYYVEGTGEHIILFSWGKLCKLVHSRENIHHCIQCPHCPKHYLNLSIQTYTVTVGADATLCVWFLLCYQKPDIYRCIVSSRTYTVASSSAVTGSVFLQRFKLYYGTVHHHCKREKMFSNIQ